MNRFTDNELKEKVKTRNYTDMEWNEYELWRFVSYKTGNYIKNGKIYIKNG